ncbi:MAG: hypothetical protein HZB65_03200, partial [Candidatus Aenigmarchaeota archaeon]|nr:hypothetical protein [Candidatus Aenigmarchaeota archaeon]
AVNSAGETKASGSQCITTQAGHNTVTMQWDTVQFAASYNIYGRTAGAIGLLTSTANTQFTDNGIALSGAMPLEMSASANLVVAGNGNFEKLCIGSVCKSQWDAVNNNLVIESRTSDPASPQTGQIWIRTDIS